MREVLVTIPVEPQHKICLENAVSAADGGRDLHFTYLAKADVTQEMVEEAEVILGNVDPKYLRRAGKLKLLQLDSAGAASYTAPGILPPGVQLANATGAYGLAVSEHMLAAVLMLMKKLHLYQKNMQSHEWRDEGQVTSISDSVTLVIGLGDIGGQFAQKMHALGSHVIGVRKNCAKRPDYVDEMYQMDELDSLLGRADLVACFLPGTSETSHLMDKERIAQMKNGALLLNAGRGSLIPTRDLCEALYSGKLGGAAIDVAEQEPLPKDSPLWDAPNLLITPHISGNYHMRQIRELVVEIAAENLKAVMSGCRIKNEVDFQTGYRKFQEPEDI